MSAPRRVGLTLSPSEHDALRQLAHEADEPLATTAGRIIRAALTDQGAKLDTPPARRAGPSGSRGSRRRAAPVEPADSIGALRARYPHELRHAPADLGADTLVGEQLDALSQWRGDLDADPDANPREVLAFGHELRTIASWLQDRARRSR